MKRKKFEMVDRFLCVTECKRIIDVNIASTFCREECKYFDRVDWEKEIVFCKAKR